MNSIRRQLTRNLLGVILVLVAGSVIALYLAAREAATEQFDHALQAKALAISTLVIPTAEGLQLEFSDRFFHGFEDYKLRDFFELWDASDHVLARSESLGATSDLPRVTGSADDPQIWNLKLPTGRTGRAIGFTFKAKSRDPKLGGNQPQLQLVVASDRDDLDETLWSLVSIVAACGVLLIVVTLLSIPRVLRKGLHPIETLSDQTAQIDAGSLHTRFAVDSLPVELRPIATRLNDLLARLESSFERERRFSADLAHELRTPIAELRSLAECALKWPETRDPATDRETLAIAEQMQRLVSYILALARAETGELAPAFETVAIGALISDAWRSFAATATEKQLNVQFDVSPVQGTADATLLRSIIVNLLDNAVDYAPRNGHVAIRAIASGNQVIVTISNDAPDLEEADIPQIFDRFWRKEAARTGGKHVGLGLSLARGFAQTMDWTLSAQHDAGKITFILSGPAGTAQPSVIAATISAAHS